MKKKPKDVKVTERGEHIGTVAYKDLEDVGLGWRILIGKRLYKVIAVWFSDQPVYEGENEPIHIVVEFSEYCDKVVTLKEKRGENKTH